MWRSQVTRSSVGEGVPAERCTASTSFDRVSQPGGGRGVLDRMPTPLPPPPGNAETDSWSRRTFIAASAVGGAAVVAGPSLLGTEPAAAAEPVADEHGTRVTVTVNGERR